MLDGLTVAFPTVQMRFINERYSVFFPFWEWKLNPFSIREKDVRGSGICVRFTAHGAICLSDQEQIFNTQEGAFRHLIHRRGDGSYLFSYIDARSERVYLQYLYEADLRRITMTEDTTDTAGMAAVEYLYRLLPDLLARHNTLLLHGVLMEHRGRGIVLTAPSGAGKSTHAHLWRDLRDAFIIDGDLSACYKKRPAEPEPDQGRDPVWTGFGMPWCGTSGEYMNREVPITDLVVLEQSPENEAQVIRGPEAWGRISPQLQLPFWNRDLSEKLADQLLDLIGTVRAIRLRCRPDAGAVEALEKILNE